MMKNVKKMVSLLLSIIMLYSCTFAETFSEADAAAYVAALNSLSGEELLACIDSYKDYSGLAETKAYIEIRERGYFTENVKNMTLELIAATDMSGMGLDDTNRVICDGLLIAALSYCDSYGMLDNLIHVFAEEIKVAGGDINGYNLSAKQPVIAGELFSMRPYSSLEEFVDRLNMLVKEMDDSNHGSASGPSYGGGGNTIGGGTSSGSYVVQWELSDAGVLIISGSGINNYTRTSQIPWYSERLNVKEIFIGENITHIGDKAFYGCINVQKITIPSAVTSIGIDTFKNCDEMTIYGEDGSYAQVYAAENQIPFTVNTKSWNEKHMTVEYAANSVKWYFDVTVYDFSDAATVFAAVYDTNGRMISSDSEELVTDDITSLSIAKNSDAVYAQIFVWDSMMKPITKKQKIEL